MSCNLTVFLERERKRKEKMSFFSAKIVGVVRRNSDDFFLWHLSSFEIMEMRIELKRQKNRRRKVRHAKLSNENTSH